MLVAVIVYVVKVESTVGVPLISPVFESMLSPPGRAGDIVHETTGPPFEFGITAVIAVPLVSVKILGL